MIVGIDGFPGYFISDSGQVFEGETPVKTYVNNRGYLTVYLHKEGHQYLRNVHRLVATAFIPNPENKRTVNHKNEVKIDNRVSNLEWMSYQENNNYGTHNRRVSEAQKGKVLSEEIRRKMSEGTKRQWADSESRKKLSESMSGENNPFYGRRHTDESKQKMHEAHVGKQCGKDNPFYGKCHTEESKKKMSEAQKRRFNKNNN